MSCRASLSFFVASQISRRWLRHPGIIIRKVFSTVLARVHIEDDQLSSSRTSELCAANCSRPMQVRGRRVPTYLTFTLEDDIL
jgi:hypothetical protein